MAKIKQFIITLVMPAGATVPQVEGYIARAVGASGGLDPDDPCYNIGDYEVRVTSIGQGFPPKVK